MIGNIRLKQVTSQKCAPGNQNEEYVLFSNYFYILQVKPEINLSTDRMFKAQAVFPVGLFL